MEILNNIKYSWYAILNILLYIKRNTIKYYKSFFTIGGIDYFAYHIFHPDKDMIAIYKYHKEEERKEKENIQKWIAIARKVSDGTGTGNTRTT